MCVTEFKRDVTSHVAVVVTRSSPLSVLTSYNPSPVKAKYRNLILLALEQNHAKYVDFYVDEILAAHCPSAHYHTLRIIKLTRF